ncbi:MAG TPA: tetratricopeptide repeat protein [Candidatus Polarisedimenticolia bacterium]|nr:tetratricopeptide repeat protein [Candidatus Polarisedimenticolia bacterium]
MLLAILAGPLIGGIGSSYLLPQSSDSPPAQTGVAAPGEEEPPTEEAPFEFTAPPVVPEEYFLGLAYLGDYREAWNTQALLDPVLGKLFLKLQSGATRQELSEVEIPDLDLALEDLTSARMVRLQGDRYRPAFPVIQGESGAAFTTTVQKAADGIYPELRPLLKKAKKAAAKEKVAPWLYALVWSEVLDSRTSEETLVDAGALDARRMRDEGYLWLQLPRDRSLVGVDRYGSGTETLQYVYNPISFINVAVQDFEMRYRILDGSLAPIPWDDEASVEGMTGFGILNAQKKVTVPALKKNSALLGLLRQASQLYVKRALASLRSESLAKNLDVPRDEAFAAAFATLGFRLLDKAVGDKLVIEPAYLADENSPSSKLVETLIVTADESVHPLEHAYYLYDRNDFAGCIKQVDDYLKDHPDDPEALFRKGIAYMKLRKYPEALESFQKGMARRAAPDDVWRGWLLIRKGNTLDMMQRRDEALQCYQQALSYADVNASHDWAQQWLEYVYQD